MRCHEDQDSALSTRGVLEGLLVNSELETDVSAHHSEIHLWMGTN